MFQCLEEAEMEVTLPLFQPAAFSSCPSSCFSQKGSFGHGNASAASRPASTSSSK